MSGTIDDEDDVRAAEYVIGVTTSEERDAFRAELERRPALNDAVDRWSRDLAPLLGLVPLVDPPPSLWMRLERSAFGGASRMAGVGAPRRALRAWQAATAGFALAAGIAGAVLLSRPTTAPPAPVPVAALLPKTAGAPVLVAEANPDGSLSVRPVGTLTVASGRDLELWSLPAHATRPVALGLLPTGGATVPPRLVPHGPGLILVSLEPRGGSPTGLPTGPVLWGGAIGG